jgi:hypothetical protein
VNAGHCAHECASDPAAPPGSARFPASRSEHHSGDCGRHTHPSPNATPGPGYAYFAFPFAASLVPASWIDRGRDPSDRRGVVVRAARGRGAEVLRLYLADSGMNTAMDQICADYEADDLELLAGFLRRTADASRTAAEKLTVS